MTNDTGSSDRGPATVVGKARGAEDFASGYLGCKHPKRYHHSKEANQVEKQDKAFECRQMPGSEGVEGYGKQRDGDRKQRALPARTVSPDFHADWNMALAYQGVAEKFGFITDAQRNISCPVPKDALAMKACHPRADSQPEI